jgi:hypothetical protein
LPITSPDPTTWQEEGVTVKTRTKVNFVGSPVTVTDDAVNGRVLVTVSPNGGGHTFDEIHLTPKASSTGVEGTMFYCSDDNSVYVATE